MCGVIRAHTATPLFIFDGRANRIGVLRFSKLPRFSSLRDTNFCDKPHNVLPADWALARHRKPPIGGGVMSLA